MKNIWKIITTSRPHHKLFTILSLIIVVGAALELLGPFMFKLMVDEIVVKIKDPTHSIDRLTMLVLVTFGVSAFTSLIQSVGNRVGSLFADRIKKYLTQLFYHKALTLPQTYFDGEVSGKIVNQLNRGILTITEFFSAASSFILPAFLQAVFTIGVLFQYSVPVAIMVTVLFPGYVFISKFSDTIYRKYQKEMNAIDDALRGRITEVIGNIKLVKGFNSQKIELDTADRQLDEVIRIHGRQGNVYHSIDFLRNLALHVILLGINGVVFYDTFRGAITLGEMVLILQLIAQVRRPLFAMSFIVSQIQNADTGSEQFFELLDLKSTEKLPHKMGKPSTNNDRDYTISLSHVSFQYETSQEVLKDVTFEFGSRQTVGLVGKSGAGKSTLVNLILKFYDPKSGTIKINGESYTDIPHAQVRNLISLVFQENELFSTTVRENVAYGIKASDEEILAALEKANARDFVMKLPQGLDAQVGERGVKLSGGQKQRIQIARAILKDAPILILDEATSNLDARSESEVQVALDNLMQKKLVLVIAHRFSTLQNADKIVVLDGGVVVDQGHPGELAKRPGIYSDLLRFQIEGNKKLLETYEIY